MARRSTRPQDPRPESLICWEALDPDDPALAQARALYETLIEPAERIPWEWIAESPVRRRAWRPGRWAPHLLLAAPGGEARGPGQLAGFAYGALVPGFGGYVCYLATAPEHRGRGIGTHLIRTLILLLRVDAACSGVPLPFVVWESRRPGPAAPAEARANWQARLRLFTRLGVSWVSGLDFLAPDFTRRQGPPVPLQLFMLPVDTPPAAFDAPALRAVAAGLLEGVYGRTAGDPLFDRTLAGAVEPALRPAAEADLLGNEAPAGRS